MGKINELGLVWKKMIKIAVLLFISSDYCTERYVYLLYVAIATYYLVFMCWKCKCIRINDKNTVLNLTPVLLFGFEFCTHHNDPLQTQKFMCSMR